MLFTVRYKQMHIFTFVKKGRFLVDTTMDLKKILPIAIIVVAVLGLVAFVVLGGPARTQAPVTQSPTGGATSQAPTQQVPSQAAPQADTLPADTKPVSSKDPATVVPDNMTLEQFCDKYYKAWMAKDWKTAYELQPYGKKSQSDVNSFAQSRESYGLTGYEVEKPVVSGNVATVVAKMNLGQNGTWATNWTFIKNDKGQWTCQDSKVSMSGGQ